MQESRSGVDNGFRVSPVSTPDPSRVSYLFLLFQQIKKTTIVKIRIYYTWFLLIEKCKQKMG